MAYIPRRFAYIAHVAYWMFFTWLFTASGACRELSANLEEAVLQTSGCCCLGLRLNAKSELFPHLETQERTAVLGDPIQ